MDFRIDDLRAEARYARERFELYRARAYGSRPTSPARLRELERAHEAATARLAHAEREQAAAEAAAAPSEQAAAPKPAPSEDPGAA